MRPQSAQVFESTLAALSAFQPATPHESIPQQVKTHTPVVRLLHLPWGRLTACRPVTTLNPSGNSTRIDPMARARIRTRQNCPLRSGRRRRQNQTSGYFSPSLMSFSAP